MSRSRLALVTASTLLTALVAYDAPAETQCVQPGGNPIVTWATAANLNETRVYFRSADSSIEHYVEMRRTSDGKLQAVLPKVGNDTSSVGYRIGTAESPGARLAAGTITVSKSCGTAPLSKESRALAQSVIVGLTTEKPIVPQGFLCDGIIASIDPEGDLGAHKCRDAVITGVAGRADARALLVQSGVSINVAPPQSAGTNPPVSSARP